MAGGIRLDLGQDSVAWEPCYIGQDCQIGADVSVGCLAHVGRNVVLGDGTRVQGGAYVADLSVLGENVFIGPNATLLNDKYPPSDDSEKWTPVIVESGAVIGGGATILPGLTIHADAVLAAGSVLTKDLPAGEVWAGNPAKYLMTRAAYEEARG
jgi:UDP-2-acetamido-3-amino-2,3-dideoxy-glucuronate N-acetyltransferase